MFFSVGKNGWLNVGFLDCVQFTAATVADAFPVHQD